MPNSVLQSGVTRLSEIGGGLLNFARSVPRLRESAMRRTAAQAVRRAGGFASLFAHSDACFRKRREDALALLKLRKNQQ